jgi:hypothetical protein
MSADTCALVAQVYPVFFLVITVRGGMFYRAGRLPRFAKVAVCVMIGWLAVAEAVAVVGVQVGGLSGVDAAMIWLSGVYLLFMVVMDVLTDILEQ